MEKSSSPNSFIGDQAGRTLLATKAILIDVLTGVISPLDDGDLVISMFALNKVAGLYGLNLAGANVSWDDLLVIASPPAGEARQSPRIIAHVNGNHYLIVTGMTADSITYIDPGAGPDKQNQVETISKADFLKNWEGNITAETNFIQPVIASPLQAGEAISARFLSKDETQKIRGAFLFFFIPAIIGAISSLGGAIASVLAGIGTIVGSVGVVVGSALSTIGQMVGGVSGILQGIGTSIFQGISFAASSLWSAVGNVGTFLSQNIFGSIAKAGFGNTLFQTAVKTGLNIAITKGLDGLGLDPVASNLISSFVSGGTIGSFNAGFTASNFIQSGVQALATQGTQTLLQKMGLDANLSSALSLASGQFINGIMQGNLGGQIVKIGQTLSTNMSLYGLEKLGTSIGFSPTVARAFSAPISLTIGQGLARGNLDGEQIIRSVQDGLYNGAVRYSLDFTVDKMGIDNPLLQGLASSAITTSISSMLDPNGNLLKDVLGKASSQIRDGLDLVSTLDFARLVQQQGISKALEMTATSVFTRSSQEDIIKAGGIAQLISGRAQLVNIDGVTLRKININSSESFYLDSHDNLVALQRTNGTASEIYSGNFSITDKGAKLMNGVIGTIHPDGSVSTIEVRDGKTYEITISKTPGTSNIITTQGPEGQTWITFDIQPDQTDLVIKPNETDVLNIDDVTLLDASAVLYTYGTAFQIDISNGHGTSISMDNQGGGSGNATIQSGLVEYLLLNGIRASAVPEGTPADYFDPNNPASFAGSLSDLGVQSNDISTVPLFEDNFSIDPIVDLTDDVINVAMTTLKAMGDKEVDDVRAKLVALETSQSQHYIPIGYSGGGQALFATLGQPYNWWDPLNPKYFQNFDTIILVGSPVLEPSVSPQSGVKRIINIYSKDDILNKMNMIPKSFGGNVEVINIELQGGLSHTNYFYGPDIKIQLDSLQAQYNELLPRTDLDSMALKFNLNVKIMELKQEVEKTLYADAFIARVSVAAKEQGRWELFKQNLPQPGSDGVIKLDPSDFAGLDLNELKRLKGFSS